ncbi:MAG: hypothetical protein DME97_06415 [Verrucomicrobia bacterium]|nr:MAG: hypothetical protein DME97_06415 [Verrucomicrobiota bacterium]
MNNSDTHSGTWLQRLWWIIRDLYRELKPCRFSFIVALLTCLVFLSVAQGTEILRTVGEGMTLGYSYGPRVCGFFATLVIWATCSWYAARVLLYVDFPNAARGGSYSKWAETHVPRLLGIAPMLIVGWGFIVAAAPYASSSPAKFLMHLLAGLCVVLAIVFYVLLILRRRWVGSAQHVKRIRDLGPATIRAVIIMLLASLILFIVFAINPVTIPQWLGMGTILFLAAACWVSVGSFLVYLSGRWQFPVITVLVVEACLVSPLNDNHIIRTVAREDGDRPDVIKSFRQWYDFAEKNDGAGVVHPLYVVATEGGGIRAAYWTATVLGELQDKNPGFASHLFAISGVSGGSLGAVVFNALLAEPTANGKLREKADAILGQDFLSPALGSMLYPDFIQRFLPFPVAYFDRGRALELGWERGWEQVMGNNRLAGSFVELWKPGVREWMPALFLNGTSVEKGHRIITTNLRLTNVFLDAEDAADTLASGKLPATKATCNIPLSTAADMSARFTYVSPAGRFRGGTHVVDGGYFENSGAITALEIVQRIDDWCDHEGIRNVDVKVIMISNDPRKPSLSIAPAKPGPESNAPGRTEPVTDRGAFLGDVMAPVYALLNTRDARGVYAQKAIRREQRPFKADEPDRLPSDTKDIVYFGLLDMDVPLPLGWMLSREAAKTMTSQLYKNEGNIKNGEGMDEVRRSLLGPPR